MSKQPSSTTQYVSGIFEGLEVLSCRSDKSFAPHLHDGYVMWLNSESGEYFSVKRNSEILKPGAISIIEPGVIHSNEPCLPHRRHLRSLYFSQQFLDKMIARIGEETSRTSLRTVIINDRKLWQQLAELHSSLLRTVDTFAQEMKCHEVFATVLGLGQAGNSQDESCGEERRIRIVSEYLHDNLSCQFTLEEIANLVGCSTYHLIRIFRRAKGLAPHSYLKQVRLEHARKLLAAGTPIVEAALESGFTDQSHLTREFKRRYGVTPGVYVRPHKAA